MSPDALLCQLNSAGVELFLEGERLRFRAPAGAYTPALRSLVDQHRGVLLDRLSQPDPEPVPQPATEPADEPDPFGTEHVIPICRCGSSSYRDVAIHGGQSVRRDCAKCNRFVSFPVWYGAEA